MDNLVLAAEYYREKLENKKFHLQIGKKGTVLEFDITFGAEHFKHLIGLHKLKDLPQVQRKSEIIYRQILDGKTTLTDISKSKDYAEIQSRIDNFCQIDNILFKGKTAVKSLKGCFNTINADYMLSLHENDYFHLFLKCKNATFALPVTFIVQHNNKYLQNSPNQWSVLSVISIQCTRPTV